MQRKEASNLKTEEFSWNLCRNCSHCTLVFEDWVFSLLVFVSVLYNISCAFWFLGFLRRICEYIKSSFDAVEFFYSTWHNEIHNFIKIKKLVKSQNWQNIWPNIQPSLINRLCQWNLNIIQKKILKSSGAAYLCCS